MQVSCRIQKLKSSNLSGVQSHNEREFDVPNSDELKRRYNRRLVGEESLKNVVMDRISKCGIKIIESGKNASTVAVEILLSASPGYFRDDPDAYGKYDLDKMESWLDRNVEFLKNKYGENLVCLDLHLDEATPHLHAIVTPIIEKDRKHRRTNEQIQIKQPAKTYRALSLDAKNIFNRTALIKLQDEAALAVSDLGIFRGMRGSKAEHTPTKHFYSTVNQEVESLTLNIQPVDKREIDIFNRDIFVERHNKELARISRNVTKHFKALTSKVTHLQNQNSSLRYSIPKYLELGEPEILRIKINNLDDYQSLGSFHEVESLVNDGKEYADIYPKYESVSNAGRELMDRLYYSDKKEQELTGEIISLRKSLLSLDPHFFRNENKNDISNSPKEELTKEEKIQKPLSSDPNMDF
jgi:hypothetical protein